MILDPEDEIRLNRIFEEMGILQSKYGEAFGEVISQRLMGMMTGLFDRMSEDEKLKAYEEIAKDAPADSAEAFSSLVFPFGRPGQQIEVSE